MLTLSVTKRGKVSRAALARSGAIPGVVYGPHQEATPISVDARTFAKVLVEAGEATIVALAGVAKEAVPTLIHEVDLDPVTSRPRHVDFYAITKGQKVEVKIPISYIGESPAVKAGHSVVKVLHEIEITADPMNLPHEFVADLSALAKVGDQIHVSSLAMPMGVELVTPAEEVIALIQEVQEEKVEEAPAPDLSAIEVEQKGKEEAAPAAGTAAESAGAAETKK